MNRLAITEAISDCIERKRTMTALVRGVRSHVTQAVASADFRDDCVAHIIRNAGECIEHGGLHSPLHVDSVRAWRMELFLWDPLFTNEPHQHNHWSVSGVMLNELGVTLYRRDVASGALRVDRRFAVTQGDTGFLIPPCIHALGNPHATRYAVTLHVFCDSEDPEARAGDTTWFGGTDRRQVASDPRVRARRDLMAALLLPRAQPMPAAWLQRIFELGDERIRLQLYKQLARTNIAMACTYGDQIAGMLRGRDQARFLELHSKLSSMAGRG